MRWSKYYLPTYKETPRDAEIPSHQLMLRAGLIKGLTSGVYSFLPAKSGAGATVGFLLGTVARFGCALAIMAAYGIAIYTALKPMTD